MTKGRITPVALPFVLLASCAMAGDNSSPWTLGVDEEVTWESVQVLSQTSADSIADENGNDGARPTISLRCTAGDSTTLELRIDWQRFISSFNTEAGFKIDDGKRNWFDFRVDDSNRITIARRASDVGTLIDALNEGSQLSVEIIPYSENATRVTFDLNGFTAGLESLRGACR